jgi:hypothetical protein
MPDLNELRATVVVDTSGLVGLTSATSEMTNAVTRSNVAFKDQASASESAAYSLTEAREAARGLGEEIGVHLPRFVSSFIAKSSTIGPVLAAAFSTIAVVGLIEVLGEVPTAIQKVIDALAGWDEESRKDYDKMIKENDQLILKNIEARATVTRLSEVGKTGTEKYTQALRDNVTVAKQVALEAAEQGAVVRDLQEKYDSMKGTLATMNEFSRNPFIGGFLQQRDQIKSSLDSAKELLNTLRDMDVELTTVKGPTDIAERRAEAERLSRAQAQATIAGQKDIGEAQITATEANVHAMRALHQLSADEETSLLLQLEQGKYDIEVKAKNDSIALLKTEGSEKAAQVTAIQDSIEALTISHNAKMQAIQDKAREEGIKQLNDESLAVSEYFKKIDQMDSDAVAKRMANAEKSAQAVIRAQSEQTERQSSAMQKSGQYGAATNLVATQGAANVEAINGMIAAEREYQTALAQSNVEESKKVALIAESKARETALGDQLTASLQRTQAQLEQISQSNPWHKMIEDMQHATTAVELQTGAFTTFTTQLNSGVGSALEGWIMGGQRIGLTMEKMFAHILASEASFVVQWLLKKAELWALDAIVGKTSQTTAALSSISANAAVAASGAAASVASIPFVGWMMAPEVAAETFATTIAWASMLAMEAGGIVPRTGIIMAHEGEAVLPRNITEMLQGAAGEGTGGTTHNTFHIHTVDTDGLKSFVDKNRNLFAAAAQSHMRRTR